MPGREGAGARSGGLDIEEWAAFVDRLYKALSRELQALEQQQAEDEIKRAVAGAHRQQDRARENREHARRLTAIAQTMARVHVVNEAIADKETLERARKALAETESARAALERRLAKLAGEEGA